MTDCLKWGLKSFESYNETSLKYKIITIKNNILRGPFLLQGGGRPNLPEYGPDSPKQIS